MPPPGLEIYWYKVKGSVFDFMWVAQVDPFYMLRQKLFSRYISGAHIYNGILLARTCAYIYICMHMKIEGLHTDK